MISSGLNGPEEEDLESEMAGLGGVDGGTEEVGWVDGFEIAWMLLRPGMCCWMYLCLHGWHTAPPIGNTIPSLRRMSLDMAKETAASGLSVSSASLSSWLCSWWQQLFPGFHESSSSRWCSGQIIQSEKVARLER